MCWIVCIGILLVLALGAAGSEPAGQYSGSAAGNNASPARELLDVRSAVIRGRDLHPERCGEHFKDTFSGYLRGGAGSRPYEFIIDSSVMCDDRFAIDSVALVTESGRLLPMESYSIEIVREKEWGMLIIEIFPKKRSSLS